MVELSVDVFLRRVMSRTRQIGVVLMLVAALVATSWNKSKPATPKPAPPPATTNQPPAVPTAPPGPPQRVDDALPVPPQPLSEDAVANRSLDDLNRDSPLKPVFFGLDSADLDDLGRDDRRALRRARHGRIQPCAWRTTCNSGQDILDLVGHLARPRAYGELWKRVSIQSRPYGRCLGAEPARSLCDYVSLRKSHAEDQYNSGRLPGTASRPGDACRGTEPGAPPARRRAANAAGAESATQPRD